MCEGFRLRALSDTASERTAALLCDTDHDAAMNRANVEAFECVRSTPQPPSAGSKITSIAFCGKPC